MSTTEAHNASRDAAVGNVDMHLEIQVIPVSDIEAAHDEFADRGIDASEIWHGPPFPPEARQPGPDPERTSYGSFFSFTDPDGNTWLVQEVTTRLPGGRRVGHSGTRRPDPCRDLERVYRGLVRAHPREREG
jgi:hypothetical protein